MAHDLDLLLLGGAFARIDFFPRRKAIDLHAQLEPHLLENFFDFVQRFMAEVLGPEHLLFRLLNQFTDILDVGILQAVLRSDRKLELVDAAKQVIVQRNRRAVVELFRARFLLEVDEHADLVLENFGRVGHGVVRLHAAVSMDLEGQTVVIGALPDSCTGDKTASIKIVSTGAPSSLYLSAGTYPRPSLTNISISSLASRESVAIF